MEKDTQRVTFVMTSSHFVQLKIMCVLTGRTMSSFVRLAIQDKIKQMKEDRDKE